MFHDILKQTLEFIIVAVILRQIIAKWVAQLILKFAHAFVIKSRRDLIIWMHYMNKALDKGHKDVNPFVCRDQNCPDIW